VQSHALLAANKLTQFGEYKKALSGKGNAFLYRKPLLSSETEYYNNVIIKEERLMKKIALFIIGLMIAGTAWGAEDRFCVIEKTPTAKNPVGAVVETTGVFVGKIVSAVEIACTGERKITVENETGECKIFPFCATTKISDKAFNTVTFSALDKGDTVKVEYMKENGAEKAKAVVVEANAGKAAPAATAK